MAHKHHASSPIHHASFRDELLCHLPYAVLSVALSLIFLSILDYAGRHTEGLHDLFHNFHFLHLVFSGTGAVLVFRRYSRNILYAILIGIFVPIVFCTLSDSVLPFIGGYYLGLDMHLHWCFWSHLSNVVPFLAVGIINGLVVGGHSTSEQIFYSSGSHFLHILISSIASALYFVSFGFNDWHHHIGFLFLFLIGAVLIPCTMSDIVVPMWFARISNPSKPAMEATCCSFMEDKDASH